MNNTRFTAVWGVSKRMSQDEIKAINYLNITQISTGPGAEEKYKEVQRNMRLWWRTSAAYDQYGAAGANERALVNRAVSVASMVQEGFGGFEISSQVYGRRFFSQSKRTASSGMTSNIASIRLLKKPSLVLKKKSNTVLKQASAVTDLVLSLEQVQLLVDAVTSSGVINVDTQTPLGMMRRQVTCDICHGHVEKKSKDPCTTCHGTGHNKPTQCPCKNSSRCKTGQQIRLAGQGRLV